MRGFPRLINVLFDCFRYHVKSPTNCLALLAHRYFRCQFCRKYVLSGLEANIGFVLVFCFFSRFFFELYSIYIGSITDSRDAAVASSVIMLGTVVIMCNLCSDVVERAIAVVLAHME